MSATNRITWEVLRSFDTSTISSSSTYYNLGGPLLHPSYKLKMVNNSNILVTISIDNVKDYDVCPAGSFWLYDETQAQINTSNSPSIAVGTQISIRYGSYVATPGTGLIYLVSQYLVQA
jgi:hypothetical protein